jgi:cytochrome b pre-mRNA-processing protein 3
MKGYAEAYYGRSEAYGKALAANDRAALSDALARNVYGRGEADDESARLADYVVRASASLAAQGADAILRGVLSFPDPESN